jgi:hypothetical protein
MAKLRINIIGGIGNQLFQYAFARALSLKFKKKIIFDYSWFLIKKNCKSEFILNKILKKRLIDQFEFTSTNNLFIKILARLNLIKYITEKSLDYQKIDNINNSYYFITGYWQNEKYFKAYRKEILNDIQLPCINYLLDYKKQDFNYVGIHLRRGDYLSKINLKIHGICDFNYYNRAISLINKKSKNNFFLIFTNDKLWAERNVKKIFHLKRFSIIYAKNDLDEFTLFTKCNHYICANSTFSWWAAWLSEAKNKIVIIPKRWFADKNLNNQINITVHNWISI